MISLRALFAYVVVVPERPADYAAPWPVGVYQPAWVAEGRPIRACLVGHAPTLWLADAGTDPETLSAEGSPAFHSVVPRTRLTLTAAVQEGALVRAASFYVARGLTDALRPYDLLYLSRILNGSLALSVLRGDQLIVAAGALQGVPLGDFEVHAPDAVLEALDVGTIPGALSGRRRGAVRDAPRRGGGNVSSEQPIELMGWGRREFRYDGRLELGAYDVYLGCGCDPEPDTCAAVALRDACPGPAAHASAQLLACLGLTREAWTAHV